MSVRDYLEDHIVRQQYSDKLSLLIECRDLISEAQLRGLPRLIEGNTTKEKIEKLCEHEIIDPLSPGSLFLSEPFLSLFDEIAPNRNFGDFDQQEIERVALAAAVSDVQKHRATE